MIITTTPEFFAPLPREKYENPAALAGTAHVHELHIHFSTFFHVCHYKSRYYT
jgi:hypothetical protein